MSVKMSDKVSACDNIESEVLDDTFKIEPVVLADEKFGLALLYTKAEESRTFWKCPDLSSDVLMVYSKN